MKKAMSIVMALILCTATFSAAFAADGVPDGYTAVYSAEDLNNIRNNLSGKYILMNDIDLSAYENWEPIGTEAQPFTGEINGNGHKIVKLSSEGGVFERLFDATIENLGICDSQISRLINHVYAGLLSNTAIGTAFKNCYTEGSIFGSTGTEPLDLAYDFCAGGITGYAESSDFKNCYSFSDIILEYTVMNLYAAGGIVGESKNCEYSCCYAVTEFKKQFIGTGNTKDLGLHTGGLVGNSVSANAFDNCFFADGVEFAVGLPEENPQSVNSLTNDELKIQLSYKGFDFENIWEMEENGYAVLDFEKIENNISKKETNYLEKAEIIKVPFNKRIVFSQSPKSPDGITIKLKYSDETTVTEKVIFTENGYYVNGELLEEAEKVEQGVYGILSAEYYMNQGKISVSYNYLALPSITDLIDIFCG